MSRFLTPFAFALVGALFSSALAHAQVSGFVYEEGSNTPIDGALVTLQTTSTRTTTAADGSFSLPGATGAGLVIVGAHKGHFNGSVTVSSPVSGVQIHLAVVAQEENPAYSFVDPLTCGACHPNQYQQWNGSPMAKAGPNTWVYDIYDGTGTPGGMGGFVYTRDSRFAESNPNSECASCHQPEPWIEDPFKALDDINSLSVGAMHGISCEVCHKVGDIDETKTNFPGIFPGTVSFTRPESGQVQYGVLGDSNYHLGGMMRSSYQPQLTAAVCAACHQDKNDPDEDGDFEEANGVISEPTYLEWLDSPYGDLESPFYADCVDCHMPSYGATTVCSVLDPPLVRDPETIRHHRIEGTTPPFLDNAVDLRLNAHRADGVFEVEVQIENNQTGHHVPTGVTVRNMILLVEAWREEDGLVLGHLGSQTVHDLGGIGDPALGYYAGLPGKFFAKHNHDINGNGPTFFTDATGILFDTRIPALATDTTRYTFEIPEGIGTYHVRARLIYRRAFRFIVDAKGWVEDGHGNPLEDVAPPYYGHLMEEAEWVFTPASVESDLPSRANLTLLPPHPNPSASQTRIRFRLDTASRVDLQVFDSQGRKVKGLRDEVMGAGMHEVAWDGRSERGDRMPNGAYLLRLRSGGQALSQRIVLLR